MRLHVLGGDARAKQHTAHIAGDLEVNQAYDRSDITLGFDFKIAPGVVVKADYQWLTNAKEGSDRNNLFNAGVGLMF